MKNSLLIIIAAVYLTLVSCSKDETENTDTPTNTQWEKVAGTATDIAIGSDSEGTVWIISNEYAYGTTDYSIKKRNGSEWQTIEGFATRIAVDQNGLAWVINSGGDIYRYSNSGGGLKNVNGWGGVGGLTAKEIAIGKNGAVWVISNQAGLSANNYKIASLALLSWTVGIGEGTKIAVDPLGNPYVTNSSSSVYFSYNGGAWTNLSGISAREISYGANGQCWVISNEPTTGGYKVKQANGAVWEDREIGAVEIAVDPNGKAWIINDKNEIYKFK